MCGKSSVNAGGDYYSIFVAVDGEPRSLCPARLPQQLRRLRVPGALGSPSPTYLTAHVEVKHMSDVPDGSSQTGNSAIFQKPPPRQSGLSQEITPISRGAGSPGTLLHPSAWQPRHPGWVL